MDIKTYFDSIKENIKHKMTNPFFGSLIIVWFIHNWRFTYTIFNFSNTEPLEKKISFIATYLDPLNFLPNLGWCILISFAVLLISYSLISLSKLITNFFEKTVTPFIYKITDTSSIATKDEYEILKLENDRLVDKLDSERINRAKLQKELSDTEARLSSLQIEYNIYKTDNQSHTTETTNSAKADIAEPSPEEIKILEYLSKTEKASPVSEIDRLIENLTRTKHYLSELRNNGLITEEYSRLYHQEAYGLSEDGRAFWVKKGIV